MTNLVIVESPAKASTIKSYLGSSYKVVASKGHVRDLPKSTLGIDIENNFEPHYINIRGKGDLIKELKKEAKKADRIFLATDPDREGEAISWHLAVSLGISVEKVNRITFNEITKTAVKDAIKAPRELDMDLVNAQQTRRIFDRIVGYKLSPFLWKKVKSGLSAGRVQSAATKIIVERENEIRAFVPQEYWTVDAVLETEKGAYMTVRYFGDTATREKVELSSAEDAQRVKSAVDGRPFKAIEVKKGTKVKSPAPPFTTSTLQQEASRKLNFQSQRTMRVAQELYEGINLGSDGGVQGLITYMRTDSLRIASEAQNAAREYIVEKFGEKYCPETPRVYKSKASAQDAHEAIRPSSMKHDPQKVKKHLSTDQYRLYKLIWDRFVASQMENAVYDTVAADIISGESVLHANGSTVKFAGFLAVYEEFTDEKSEEKQTVLPELKEKEILTLLGVDPTKHFTEPPLRYTEASLIKALEEKGIGRPSTYTPTITTIIQRDYVERMGKSLKPTPLGEVTTKVMKENFSDIINYEFTANMESDLDDISVGQKDYLSVLNSFYAGFKADLDVAYESMDGKAVAIPEKESDIICDKCGAKMVIKKGRFGRFAACPNYPECKNTKSIDNDGNVVEKKPELKTTGEKCELCGGDLVVRKGRFNSFIACSNYPKCKFTKSISKETGGICPACGSKIVQKRTKSQKTFYSCEKYPECGFSTWDMPTEEKCADCGSTLFLKKSKGLVYCAKDGCGFSKQKTEQKDVSTDEN